MRNKVDLTPGRYSISKTSRSNKFISSFNQHEYSDGIVEKRSSYNWVGYIWSVVFTIVVGLLTYVCIDFLMF